MSDKLPRDVDGPALVRALTRSGFVLDRQSGSHAVLAHILKMKRIAGRLICVVYRELADEWIVITVYAPKEERR